MPYNGSGGFSLYTPGNPVVTNTTISSTWWNNTGSDLATGLSTCLTKDGQTTPTANIPMGGFKITGLGAGTGTGDAVRYQQAVLITGVNAFTANQPMGGFKLTGLAAGTTAGDSIRYEQSAEALLTAKGSLISASAANTPSILAVGSNGTSLLADSAGTAGLRWDYSVVKGYISGLTMSTAGGSATMTIAAGVACDSTGARMMTLTSAISKTTSAWAVGTGNGGIDTGAVANNTWYHFHEIQRVDTGVVDVLFSLSATAPTMPANYTLFRRIGSGRTNGSAQWTLFTQNGDTFRWDILVNDVNVLAPGTSAVTRTLTVPTGIVVIANIVYGSGGVSTNHYDLVTALVQTDSTPSATLFTSENAQSVIKNIDVTLSIPTNTSAQIRTRQSASGASDPVIINTFGWTDLRGKDG